MNIFYLTRFLREKFPRRLLYVRTSRLVFGGERGHRRLWTEAGLAHPEIVLLQAGN